MKTRQLLLAASLAVLAGCGSDKVTTVTGFNGALSFTYTGSGTGSISGSFSATGSLPASSANQMTQQWAAGVLSNSDGGVYGDAAVPATASTHHFFGFFINRTTVGSSTINTTTCTSASCPEVFFLFGAPNSGSSLSAQTCSIDAGTIAITEITSTRVKGTFSGTGQCFTPSFATTNITISNGTFDLALVGAIP